MTHEVKMNYPHGRSSFHFLFGQGQHNTNYLHRTAGMSSCFSRLKGFSLNTSQLDNNGDQKGISNKLRA